MSLGFVVEYKVEPVTLLYSAPIIAPIWCCLEVLGWQIPEFLNNVAKDYLVIQVVVVSKLLEVGESCGRIHFVRFSGSKPKPLVCPILNNFLQTDVLQSSFELQFPAG